MPAGSDPCPSERALVKAERRDTRDQVDFDNLKTMRPRGHVVGLRDHLPTGRRRQRSTQHTPLELSALVERADLGSRRMSFWCPVGGEGFCAGFDLSAYAERSSSTGGGAYQGTVLDGTSSRQITQMNRRGT